MQTIRIGPTAIAIPFEEGLAGFTVPPQQFMSLVVSHDCVTAILLALHPHQFILTDVRT